MSSCGHRLNIGARFARIVAVNTQNEFCNRISMGWGCTLFADRDIQESHIDTIVDTLPEDLKCCVPGFQPSKQHWGWSCATDISKPRGRELFISGAGFSAGKAEAMRDYLKKALEIYGYRVRATKIED